MDLAIGEGKGLISEPWHHNWGEIALSWGTLPSQQAQYDALSAETSVADWLTAEALQFARIRQEIDLRFAYRDPIDNMLYIGKHICAQMIGRFVSSEFSGAYFRRVYAAYESGTYTLPDGSSVGSGEVSDLTAMIASVLFDPEVLTVPESSREPTWGRYKTDVLALCQAVRPLIAASEIGSDKIYERVPVTEDYWDKLKWAPFNQPSTFGYGDVLHTPPGTVYAQRNILSPELQTVNDIQVRDYVQVIRGVANNMSATRLQDGSGGLDLDLARFLAVADQTNALIDLLDTEFTAGFLRDDTRARIAAAINTEAADGSAQFERFLIGWVCIATCPEFLVQR